MWKLTNVLFDFTEYLKNFSLESSNQSNLDHFLNLHKQRITLVEEFFVSNIPVKKYINEFWTSKQRQASSLHEISYRACFKPQLPRFFISLLTQPQDVVYDPFAGRGTTILEAALLNRNVIANDINPLSKILIEPRLVPPDLQSIKERLKEIPFDYSLKADIDLSMFYERNTEAEIVSLKNYLQKKVESESESNIDKWIRMIATNRLTGHSRGFFSVYTLPPNQAVSPESQIKINKKKNQEPEYRNVKEIILTKTASLLKDITETIRTSLRIIGNKAKYFTCDARYMAEIENESVKLTVTSPPFLNVVQYSKDNWLRCWFNAIDVETVSQRITMAKKIEQWVEVMNDVFKQLYRITEKKGWVAFEVGEIMNGKVKLEEFVIPIGLKNGFECFGVLINDQEFTKTSNIWGINNNTKGTNTNRVVIFNKK